MTRCIHRTAFLLLLSVFLILVPATLSAESDFSEPEGTRLFFTLGPVGILNTDTLSAPSPIKSSLGFGASFPITEWFAVSPSLSVFTNYYLWRSDEAGDRAYPAEVENRTALVPSALIDVPAVFYLRSGNSTLALGLGASFFARYAFLADSVPESESGDIDNINDFFYSGMRFLYPSVQFSYDYLTESGVKAGVVLKALFPLGSLMEDRGLDGGLATIAFRLMLPEFSE